MHVDSGRESLRLLTSYATQLPHYAVAIAAIVLALAVTSSLLYAGCYALVAAAIFIDRRAVPQRQAATEAGLPDSTA